MAQAEPYLDHLTSCSPCYRDFLQLQSQHRQRRTRMIFAVAASVLIVAGLATWAVLRQHNSDQITAVVDLRDRSMTRGVEPPREPPVQIPRNVARLEIYLPLGSSDGPYDVRITSIRNETVFSGTSDAKLDRGLTVLRIALPAPWTTRGSFVLQVRKQAAEWVSFPLEIR